MTIDLKALPCQMWNPLSPELFISDCRALLFSPLSLLSLFISSDYFWFMTCNLLHRALFSIKQSVSFSLHFSQIIALQKKFVVHSVIFSFSLWQRSLDCLSTLSCWQLREQTNYFWQKLYPVACQYTYSERETHSHTQPSFTIINWMLTQKYMLY